MNLLLMTKVTVLLATVGIGCLLLRRRSAAARHLVAIFGLTASLALPVLVGVLPAWELPILTPTETGGEAPAVGYEPADEPRNLVEARATRPSAPAHTVAAQPRLERVDESGRSVLGNLLGSSSVLAWLWIAGSLFVVTRLTCGWLRMTRIAIDAAPLNDGATWDLVHDCRKRLAIPGAPRVMLSSDIRVPVLWGFLQPVLILPDAVDSWPTDRLRVVLLHELAHLKRKDGLALLIGRLTAAAWWFHPLVWFLEGRARQDCERACDDMVVDSGERPSEYARHLLEIAGSFTAKTPLPAEALSIMGHGQLENRLQSILRPGPRRVTRPWAVVAIFAVVALTLASIASATPVARPSVDKPDTASHQVLQAIGVKAQAKPEILLAHEEGHDQAGAEAFQLASKLHNQERWQEAADAFLEAAEAGYKVGTSTYNAACGYARMGDDARAIELIERAVDAGFDGGEYLMEDSDLDPIRQRASFQSMIDRLRDDGRLRHMDGMDNYESAVDRYEDLRSTDSTDGHAWYKVGSALLGLRDFDRGIDSLERAAEYLEHGNSNALYNLACAHSLAGQTRQALDYLDQAVVAGFSSEERFENDTDLDNIRGEARFEEIRTLSEDLSLDAYRGGKDWGGEYSERRWAPAVEKMSRLVEERPDLGRAWSNLGWALHHSRRHEEARDAFTRQLDLDFRPGLATYNIACTYAMEGKTDLALDWLGRAVDMEVVSPQHMMRDEDLESLHDDPRFESLLERAIEMEAKRHDGHEDRDDHDGHGIRRKDDSRT